VKSLRHFVPLLVMLSLAALLSGCGQNSTVTGPNVLDEAPPAPPTQIGTALNESGSALNLVWTASTSANVATYEVYQYAPDPSRENAYVLIGATDAATTQIRLAVTESERVTYRLRSVSALGTRSEWSTAATLDVAPPPTGAPELDDPNPGYMRGRD
jgi:hypothetical protein